MNEDELRKRVELQAQRMKKAERERPTIWGQTVFIGVLGILFVLPVVGGAYLGQWLDQRSADFSGLWTPIMIVAGVVVGGVNVYLYVRE